jgi:AcrR family transcriptional regulator
VARVRGTREARRAEIIDAAAGLFDRHGFHGTSMDDIAVAVGIRKPTLYHHVRGKDEILYFIHEEFIDLAARRHAARAGTPMAPDQQLLEIMTDILEVIESHNSHVRVFFDNYRELRPEDHEALSAKRHAYSAAVEQVIRDGVASGEFRDVDPRLTTLALFGACNWAYTWFNPEGKLRPREIAYTFWSLFLVGLVPPDERPAPRRRRAARATS